MSSGSSNSDQSPPPSEPELAASETLRKSNRKGSEWEILGNLEKGQLYSIKPKRHEGFLNKKRKWPMKGWHKRYFVLENGILTYGKTANDIQRGRTHGRIDVGRAVVSAKYESYRIDIDDEASCVHHLKCSNMETFGYWLEQLKQNRLFQQYQLQKTSPLSPIDDTPTPGNSLPRPRPGGLEFKVFEEKLTNQLLNVQSQALSLSLAAQKLEDDMNESTQTATLHKSKKLFGLVKKKSSSNQQTRTSSESAKQANTSGSSDKQDMEGSTSTSTLLNMAQFSSSNPSINSLPASMSSSMGRPASLPGPADTGSPQAEVLSLATKLHEGVSQLLRTYPADLDRLRSAINTEKTATITAPSHVMVASLRQSLQNVMYQNQVLRTKLQKIHLDADLNLLPTVSATPASAQVDTLPHGTSHSLSYSSSCMSSEFFDAREYASDQEPSDSSEEESDDDSNKSQSSESETDEEQEVYEEASSAVTSPQDVIAPTTKPPDHSLTHMIGRRQKLPVPKTDTEGINLWNLLCKNIGKDLSKISMPVTLNEPLNVLQRLCEELEYSDLLEKAANGETPVERMMWVAAFAISAYGSCNARAGHKPFNPLLGETFENVREDRGFRYVSEQVSHHPPVSACHATSKKWTWWQDLRVKTKFWGKSMEFQPEGSVTLCLNIGDKKEKYTWNKITTCIHNLFGSDRWVDLYGQCTIEADTGIKCKIDFVKASYWSNKKHELFGAISDKNGVVQQNLFGKWSEAIYCGKVPSARCIWRPGTLPEDSQLYYGFSRFAIELNEILEHEKPKLPKTDTRFRPDQRLLEAGQITEAENMKLKLEQQQRERRQDSETKGISHTPMWFRKLNDSDHFVFNDKYWVCRENPGFDNMSLTGLW